MEEGWRLREEYETDRFLKRIGAPDDDHFDDLRIVYNTIVAEEEEEFAREFSPEW